MAVRNRKPEGPQPIRTYGLPLTPEQFAQKVGRPPAQLDYEMAAFRYRWPIEKGALPRFEHFKNICRILWPAMIWHPWMETGIEAMCNEQFVSLAGCASSTKTCMFVTYSLVWWLCAPECSTVILTSTTKGLIRKRAWPWLIKLYSSIPGERIGSLVDSKTTLQARKGDDLNAIFAIAVRDGSTAKAMAGIQGIHNKRILVGVDEATDTPQAIFDVAVNLIAGCTDFGFCAIGNPASHFDPHGKFSEPKGGWNSVSVDSDEWETVPQINGKTGKCIHFDATKSPNITLGETRYSFLPTQSLLESQRKTLGSDSPLLWKYGRGFWAPEGIVRTVVSESLLLKHEVFGKYVWSGGRKTKLSFCDPAFGGGDRAVLRFGEMGEAANGTTGLELTDRVLLQIRLHEKEPVHYQLARQIKEHCESHGVSPSHFGLDSTGEGGGLADILSREWSSEIIRVEFGGKPSDRMVSNEDRRPAFEAYDRKVTEIWFTVKELICSGQLKGLDQYAADDFCKRMWRDKGRKIEIEPKSKAKLTGDAEETGTWGMKQRVGRSPDDGDSVGGICQVAVHHGLIVKLQGATIRTNDSWMKVALKMDEVYHDQVEVGSAISQFALDDIE